MATNITRFIENVEDASNIISYVDMKQRQSGVFSFILPLRTKQYDLRNNIKTILNSDIKSDLSDIIVEEDALSLNVFREDYIKQFLESNCHKIVPQKLVNNSKNIIVEFSSPNIAKPFHLGHLRSTIIGNYVANINSYLGNNVKRINYLGDWGTQYGFIQIGIDMSNLDSTKMQNDAIRNLYNAYVLANKSMENDSTIADKAREIFRQLETGESIACQEWELFRKLNCWPSENGEGGWDVNIEYELEQDDLELNDVNINIPLPIGCTPIVSSCDGQYTHETRKNILVWSLPLVDASTKSGSMEFSAPSSTSADFFPLHVSFASKTSYAKIKITEVILVEDESPVKHSIETVFFTDNYEVV
ncbi:hypothetical protein HZH68_010870 [Vespula germanica]|uniref:Probable arginine--tRNA ligase, mitochondrial n=1 Tax=Vespula germanica TaxID=30212 RepID=A0A834JYP4_VESGE|nr:hypothetical protein HZH68_010870 [Vespula germanica]